MGKIARLQVKITRKLRPKTREIVISRYPRGLLKKSEIKDIISVLGKAKLPAMRYEYHGGFPWEKELLYLIPKSQPASKVAPKVRKALEAYYGKKYRVAID